MKDLATIAYPLTRLTQKNRNFSWDDDCQKSFETLKQLLVSAPILSYPETDGDFILDTDGSQFGIGAVLSQIQNGEERVIAYASKSLNKAQQRYCTTFTELLAVVTFIRHFRRYLWGRHFLVRTDHSSLTWLRNFKDPEGMIARWLTILDTYNFNIQHRKGMQMLYLGYLGGNAKGLTVLTVVLQIVWLIALCQVRKKQFQFFHC